MHIYKLHDVNDAFVNVTHYKSPHQLVSFVGQICFNLALTVTMMIIKQ
jgi:hypothetical protein